MYNGDERWPTLNDIFDAYFDCRRRKRNTINQLAFEQNLEPNLVRLWREIHDGSYVIGPSIAFVVTKPKVREIWAADFRDRIVHHLIYNAIAGRFECAFVRDSYGSLRGRGIHDGMHRARYFARAVSRNYSRMAYVAKIDIANFFMSIDKPRLETLLYRRASTHCCWPLLQQVLHSDCRVDAHFKSPDWLFECVPPHKSLLHAPETRGLPIGNLTSQFFANVYLHELDLFVKHELCARYYGRLVDDMILMHEDPRQLTSWIQQIDNFLHECLALALNPGKTYFNKVSAGFDFCGFWIKPGRVYLRQRTWRAAKARVAAINAAGTPVLPNDTAQLVQTTNSYLGMLHHVNGYRARRALARQASNLFVGPKDDYRRLAQKDRPSQ